MVSEPIQEIIDELKLIPKNINTEINIKKLTEEVSKELAKKSNRSFS